MPDSVEIPAPVSATMRVADATQPRTASNGHWSIMVSDVRYATVDAEVRIPKVGKTVSTGRSRR